MFDAGVVKALIEASRPATTQIGDHNFIHPDYKLDMPRMADSVEINTLMGLVEFLKSNIDSLAAESLLVHVKSPAEISVLSTLDDYGRRQQFARVISLGEAFKFDVFHTVESFRIGLMSRFQISGDMAVEGDEYKSDDTYLLEISSGITRDASKNVTDDGVKQHVALRNGFALNGQKAALRPIVYLRPFRTFREIEEQPASPFVFRVSEKNDEITLGLFEADGGAWKLDAVKKIKAFLDEKLADTGIVVIA